MKLTQKNAEAIAKKMSKMNREVKTRYEVREGKLFDYNYCGNLGSTIKW
jgi:hypothetical protein